MANNHGQQTRAQLLQRLRNVVTQQNQLIDQFQNLIAEEILIKSEFSRIQARVPKLIGSPPLLAVKEVSDGKAD